MATSKALKEARGTPQFQQIVDTRRRERMAKIDALPADLRECVYDYGWTVVNAFMLLGINKPRHLRHLVETVLNEFSPTRGACSSQGADKAAPLSGNDQEARR